MMNPVHFPPLNDDFRTLKLQGLGVAWEQVYRLGEGLDRLLTSGCHGFEPSNSSQCRSRHEKETRSWAKWVFEGEDKCMATHNICSERAQTKWPWTSCSWLSSRKPTCWRSRAMHPRLLRSVAKLGMSAVIDFGLAHTRPGHERG